MDSKELNERIEAISDDADLYQCFGGKAIPYVGWYWRDVDFDSDTYCFCEYGEVSDLTGPSKVYGFMENNKWGYGYAAPLTKEEWVQVRAALEKAVTTKTPQDLQAADLLIREYSKRQAKEPR